MIPGQHGALPKLGLPADSDVRVTCRSRPRLTFIDAGITTELTAQDRTNFIDLFYAIATGEQPGRERRGSCSS